MKRFLDDYRLFRDHGHNVIMPIAYSIDSFPLWLAALIGCGFGFLLLLVLV